jgi:hypothetical protein
VIIGEKLEKICNFWKKEEEKKCGIFIYSPQKFSTFAKSEIKNKIYKI